MAIADHAATEAAPAPRWRWGVIVAVVLALVGGYHNVLSAGSDRRIEEALEREVPDVQWLVNVNPWTNFVAILGYAPEGHEAHELTFRESFKMSAEDSMRSATRRSFDVYAMVLPYRVDVAIERQR